MKRILMILIGLTIALPASAAWYWYLVKDDPNNECTAFRVERSKAAAETHNKPYEVFKTGAALKDALNSMFDACTLSEKAPPVDTPPDLTFVSCSDENQVCKIPSGVTATVRYGTLGLYVIKQNLTGDIPCNNTYFGKDPSVGKIKSCEYAITSGSVEQQPDPVTCTAPAVLNPTTNKCEMPVVQEDPPASGTADYLPSTAIGCAELNKECVLPAGIEAKVWYGAGQKYYSTRENVTGSITCNNSNFTDPNPKIYKRCYYIDNELLKPTLDPKGQNLKPVPDMSKIPASSAGVGVLQLRAAAIPEDRSNNPMAGGEFRIGCDYAKMATDDPIVYPNVPGASHLHTFFGNVSANAYSTNDSLRNNGNGTCAGGIGNRSGYWVPSLINASTGEPMRPADTVTYYKSESPKAATYMQAPPNGLRIISGNANPLSIADSEAHFFCQDKTQAMNPANWGIVWQGNHIESCGGPNQTLRMVVSFPSCWDGKNLDSPDHNSHMAHACKDCDLADGTVGTTPNGCPITHPVAIPLITINADYKNLDPNAKYRLSSDNYSSTLPGGYSGHGDWMNGWDEKIMSRIINNCMHKHMNCGGPNLGDGQELYGFYNDAQ